MARDSFFERQKKEAAKKREQIKKSEEIKKDDKLIYDKKEGVFQNIAEHNKQKAADARTPVHINKFTVVSLLLPPLIISFISAFHLVRFFNIGNIEWVSIFLAASFEVLSLSALIAIKELSVLDKFSKAALWIMILLLVSLQISGNVYSVWAHIDKTMASGVALLLGVHAGNGINRAVAIFQGSILPISALAFIKILANYLTRKAR